MIIPSYRTFPRAETTPVSSLQTFSWSLLYFSLEIFLEYLKIFPLLYFSLEPLTPHNGWNPHMAPWCPWWQMLLTQVVEKHLFTAFPEPQPFPKPRPESELDWTGLFSSPLHFKQHFIRNSLLTTKTIPKKKKNKHLHMMKI